jgi:hypothetical protein
MRTAARIAATPLVLLITVAAGAGWLELLRRSGALHAGARITGALPLDRLAGHAGQPLLRVLAAWIPAGLACGAALYAMTGWSRPVRGMLAGLGGFAIVFVAGGLSDAVTASDPLGSHFSAQWHHQATWLVPVILAACAVIPGRSRPRRDARAVEPGASSSGRGAPAAA